MKKISSKNKYITKVKIKILPPFICKICGKKLKSASGIATHILNKHDGMLYQDYLLNFLGIDSKKINKEWMKKSDERKKAQLDGLKRAQNTIRGLPIKKRLSKKQYEIFRNNMKGMFSLPWHIKKYGEIDGNIKYNERCKKISESTYLKKYNSFNKMNWSAISQKLFWEIYNIIKNDYNKIYFGELNHEFSCGVAQHNFDFVIRDIKKVIEFNGDKFHANPSKYQPFDIPIKFINKKAKDIWEEDKIKLQKVINNGYELKIVWENDYKKNKKRILSECLNFIKN